MKTKSSFLLYLSLIMVLSFVILLRNFKHPPRQKPANSHLWEAPAQIYGQLSREDGSPQSTSPAYCESSLKVPDIRRNTSMVRHLLPMENKGIM